MAPNFIELVEKTCEIEGCSRPFLARGLCGTHYQRWYKNGSPFVVLLPWSRKGRTPPEERFWAKVDKEGPLPTLRPDLGPCWVWTGYRQKDDYGVFNDSFKTSLAHRFSYELEVGPVPEGLELDHLCRTRSCVRPSHLEPVAHLENVRRGARW